MTASHFLRLVAVLVVATLAVSASASHAKKSMMSPFTAPKWDELTAQYSFDDYVRHFTKPYDRDANPQEYELRRGIFDRRLSAILAHNARGDSTYKMGVNRFTDQTSEERKRLTPTFPLLEGDASKKVLYSKWKGKSKASLGAGVQKRRTVDWRAVTPPVLTGVKDQGFCGSCWAFGTTATLESHYALTFNKLIELSPQQLISCVPAWNVTVQGQIATMGGCNGMFPSHAMEYLIGSGGLTQEFMYPYYSYFAQNGSSTGTWPACSWRARYAMTPTTGYVEVDRNDQDAVMTAVANDGPVTAVIYVLDSFFDYEAGIYSNSSCVSDQMQPSHVVQIIGYGHDAVLGHDYWLMRNSWSPLWGDQGYFRLLKTDAPMCGQMMWAVNDQFTNITSCGMCGVITNNLFPKIADMP